MIKLVLEEKKSSCRVVSCNAIFGLSHYWRIFKGNFNCVFVCFNHSVMSDSLQHHGQ